MNRGPWLSSNGDSLAHIAIDPVCELHVDVPTAEHRYDVGRRTVYFSSLNCKKKFAADPIAFASQNSEMAQTYTCGKCRTCDMTLKPERVIGTAVDPVCAMDVHSATTENRVVFGYLLERRQIKFCTGVRFEYATSA
jgi:YHS domain-containing protein